MGGIPVPRATVLAIAILLLGPLLPSPGAALPAYADGELRLPILIEGDDGFARPDAGVRSGSGTAVDPYVISGWTFLLSEPAAIELRHTRAHVVIEDVVVDGRPGYATMLHPCLVGPGPCDDSWGIHLVDAQNVTIRDVRIDHLTRPIHVTHGSKGILVERAITGQLGGANPFVIGTGIGIEDSSGVVIRASDLRRANLPLEVLRSRDVQIEGGRTESLFYRPAIRFSQDVVLRDGVHLAGVIVQAGLNVSILRNRFLVEGAVYVTSSTPDEFFYDKFETRGVLVCGNTISGSFDGVGVIGARDVLVTGNKIQRSGRSLNIDDSERVRFERNVHANASQASSIRASKSVDVHQSRFEPTSKGVSVSGAANLTENWWGHASGPAPGGSGVPVTGSGALVSPWLTAPPSTEVDCDALSPPSPNGKPLRRTIIDYGALRALVVRARSAPGEALRVEVTNTGDWRSDLTGLIRVYGFAPDQQDRVYATSTHITGIGHTADASLFTPPADVEVTWPFPNPIGGRTDFFCADGCSLGVVSFAGYSRGGNTRLVIETTDEHAEIDIQATDRTGFASLDTMDGYAARVGAPLTGASAALLLSKPFEIERSLWSIGLVEWDGVAPTMGYYLDRPDGTDWITGWTEHHGGPTGSYQWRYNGTTIGGKAHVYGLWADIDFDPVNL